MPSEPYLGEISMFGGNFTIRGYAPCNGQLLSISQNTALFSILGTTYGGNGRTDFGLPDLRGRCAIGVGQGAGLSSFILGQNGGSQNVTLNINQMPAHSHPVTVTPKGINNTGDTADPTDAFAANSGTLDKEYRKTGTQVNMGSASAITVITGGNQPHENMQPFLVVTFLIAIEGIFPQRN